MENKPAIFRVKQILLIQLFIFSSIIIFSQEPGRHISLQEATDSTLSNNRDLQLADLDEKISASAYKETNRFFLPQVNLSYNFTTSDNPLNVFGFKLQQQSVTAADFNPLLLNQPGSRSDFTTQLKLQQPILNAGLFAMRKAAADQVEIYKFKSSRTKDYLRFQVEKAYLQLQLAWDAKGVVEEALAASRAFHEFISNHVSEGMLQKSDELNARLQVTSYEASLAEANSNIGNASDYLSLMMGRKPGVTYIPDPKTQLIPAEVQMGILVPSDRADILAMQKAVDASGEILRSLKLSYLPKLNAFGAYQLNDKSPVKFGSGSYIAGVQLSWDLFNGNGTRHKITTQKFEQKKLQEQLIKERETGQVEINKSIREATDAESDIIRQRVAIESAAEALRILMDRHQQGLVNTTDVLMAQARLSQQKLALVQATFTKNTTAAYLLFLTTSVE